MLTQNATWCQNRGCICISSARRTYGRIHSSFLHPAYIQTIILWTELFPKKRREKIQGEILQSIFEYRIQWCFHISTRTTRFLRIQCILQCFHTQSSKFPVIPCKENYSTYRINPLHEISKKYYNYKAHPVQINTRHLPATVPVHPSILHGRIQP